MKNVDAKLEAVSDGSNYSEDPDVQITAFLDESSGQLCFSAPPNTRHDNPFRPWFNSPVFLEQRLLDKFHW